MMKRVQAFLLAIAIVSTASFAQTKVEAPTLKESKKHLENLAASNGSGRAGGNPGDITRQIFVTFDDYSVFELEQINRLAGKELRDFVSDVVLKLQTQEILDVEEQIGPHESDPSISILRSLEDPNAEVAFLIYLMLDEIIQNQVANY